MQNPRPVSIWYKGKVMQQKTQVVEKVWASLIQTFIHLCIHPGIRCKPVNYTHVFVWVVLRSEQPCQQVEQEEQVPNTMSKDCFGNANQPDRQALLFSIERGCSIVCSIMQELQLRGV